ncbi:hypothetical protein CTAYLR_002631 [Chrysophaeum taylorii]|uniref:PH domain-containing protein n=1 Tax=Chrysophaeum taylorii TaxID=2483200 RepID=A0AAD7UDC2_9STRA|nr:hypothetical protein CTAYLR_002631 [Chrysophaeum taylorii]
MARADRFFARTPPRRTSDRIGHPAAEALRLSDAHDPPKPLFSWFRWGDALDASQEEAAGWLHHETSKRRWFVLRSNEIVGPFLEYFAAPGGKRFGRIMLHGCEISAGSDADSMFEFIVAHPHQRTARLSCVNLQTRKQWVSVLSQLIREHAQAERQADADYKASLRKLHANDPQLHHKKLAQRSARRRITILDARANADDTSS